MSQGICRLVVDDLAVGGNTKEQTKNRWKQVLQKLSTNNLKLTPEKTRIFP